MQSREVTRPVPHFIDGLFYILKEGRTIKWLTDTTFIVLDWEKVKTEELPKYYIHKNIGAFRRCLTRYGFQKLSDDCVARTTTFKVPSWFNTTQSLDEMDIPLMFYTKGKGYKFSETETRKQLLKKLERLNELKAIKAECAKLDSLYKSL